MNCDDAFDCLTDPARRESRALRVHLKTCRRCAHMQTVLEPALALFDIPATFEAVDDASYRDVDQTAADTASRKPAVAMHDSVRLAASAAYRLQAASAPRSTHWQSAVRPALGYAAALVIGAAAALALFQGDAADEQAAPQAEPCSWQMSRMADARHNADVRTLLAACIACHLNPPAQRQPAAEAGAHPEFSSICLWSQKKDEQRDLYAPRPAAEVKRVVLSCVACHVDRRQAALPLRIEKSTRRIEPRCPPLGRCDARLIHSGNEISALFPGECMGRTAESRSIIEG